MFRKIVVTILCFLLIGCSSSKKTVQKPENYKENALVIDAVTELNNGSLTTAESLFKKLIKEYDNATAMYYLSNIYALKGDMDEAIKYGKLCVEKSDNLWFKIQLCEFYMALQDYENSALMLEEITKQEPQTLEYWQQLALIYHINKEYKKELSVLDRMEERFGVNEVTSMQKFQIYREQNNSKKAEQEILKLSENYPTQSKYPSILAELKMKEKDYNKALFYYKKVQEIDPEEENLNITFANYYMVKGNEDSTFYYLNKAMLQKNLDTPTKINVLYSVYGNEVDSDTTVFQRFFSLLKSAESVDTNDCRLYFLLNTGYMKTGDDTNGIVAGRKAVEKGCTDYALYQNLLFGMSTHNMPDEVIEIANQAIENYPEQPIPYLFKGINQELKKDFNAAIESFLLCESVCGSKDRQVLEDCYSNLADCYHLIGEKEKSFSYYEKALKLNSSNIYILNNYAYYLALENKNLDKALDMIEKVIKVVPDNITYLDTYAYVLYMKGEYSKAKKVMESITIPKEKWDNVYKEHYEQILQKLR